MRLSPIRLKKECEAAVRAGMPWIYAGDMIESSEHLLIPAGSLVTVENAKGQRVGTGYFNAASPIACRMLTLRDEPIDAAFFRTRIEKAMAAREKKIAVPYYRLVHSEADGLPGLLVDRFGDALVVQVGTAGMEALQPLWMDALEEIVKPTTIIFRNDTSARNLEKLAQGVRVVKGEFSGYIKLQENDCIYLADLLKGQKTGWFYDQRDNRKMVADMAKGRTVLDVFSHSGGFALLAAKEGARAVTLVDSSQLALDLAKQAASLNQVEEKCEYLKGDAAEVMQALQKEGRQFDVVLVDPPAYIKSKKDFEAGMKGYEKLARLAAPLIKPDGYIFMASCSHHASRSRFNKAVVDGLKKGGRQGKALKETGASCDHPRHPALPQSEYLKGILLHIA
ncbi:MAG: class I SAM-dependent rRNA methyltransferase [Alphaproteobacteria bacterium]